MPLPRGLHYLLAGPFLVDRMDTWVLIGSVAFLLACVVGLSLWQLVVYLVRKLPRKPRKVRDAPEPPSAIQSPKHLADDDPERLQQTCTALEDSLAEIYLELAESWLRRGQNQQAAAVLKKIVQLCPDRHKAQLAQDRLLQIGHGQEDNRT